LLDNVAAWNRYFRMPFAIGGDWNLSAEELQESGWPERVGAAIVAPKGPTNFPGGVPGRTLDYFVVSKDLLPFVQDIWVEADCPETRPHRPVIMTMLRSEGQKRVRVQCKPKPLPTVRKPGPLPDIPEITREAGRALKGVETAEDLTQATGQWLRALEEEVLNAHGLAEEAGYRGRAEERKYRWVNPFAHKNSALRPKGNNQSRMWRTLAQRLDRYVYLWHLPTAHFGTAREALAVLDKVRGFKIDKDLKADDTLKDRWQWFRGRLENIDFHSRVEVKVLAAQLQAMARKIEDAEARKRLKEWQKHAKAMTKENGGRLAHRWIKGPAQAEEAPLDAGIGRADFQTEAEGKARKWHELWWEFHPGDDHVDLDDLKTEEEVPRPTVDQTRLICKSFSRNTGLGIDAWNPRCESVMSDELMEGLAYLVWLLIKWAHFPDVLAQLWIVLLPKPTGGTRPIGLYAMLLRIASKWVRRMASEPWEAANAREYFYGGKGASTETCVWRQALFGELAYYQSRLAATVLMDLYKAYETMKHAAVIRAARKYQYPLWALRYILATYRMERALTVGPAHTKAIKVCGTVVAGESNATTMLRLLLIGPCDEVVQYHPNVHLAVLVDDLQIQKIGDTEKEVDDELHEAEEDLTQGLVQICEMKPADEKRQLVTSTAGLAARFGRRKKDRRALAQTVRNLGLDYGGGKPNGSKVRRGMLSKVRKRMRRLRILRKARANTRGIVQAGIKPAMLWGSGVTGVNNTCLRAMRQMARAGVILNTKGRSLTLDLMLLGDKFDPVYWATEAPVKWWLCELRRSTKLKGQMLRAFGGAIRDVGTAKNPWSLVRGPAGAVVASLRRVGWKCKTAHLWVTHKGEVNVLTTAKAEVLHMLAEAILIWQWQQVTKGSQKLKGIGPAPSLEGIRGCLQRAGKDWTWRQIGCLRSAAAGGQWSPERRREAGYGDGSCKNCGKRGTDFHRLYGCEPQQKFMREYGDDGMWELLWDNPEWPIWTCGIAEDPTWTLPPPVQIRMVFWTMRPVNGMLPRNVYGDGSGRYRSISPKAERCGWGFAAYGRHLEAVAHGPLPGWWQSVPAAESMAFLMALENAGPTGIDFHTDCQLVVDCWEKGRVFSCDGWFFLSEMWEKIMDRAEDIGVTEVKVTKVKAHLGLAHVGIRITAADFYGNQEADTAAKAGADEHPIIATVLRAGRAVRDLQKRVCRYIGRALARYGKDIPRDVEETTKAARKEAAKDTRCSYGPHARWLGNVVKTRGGRWRCQICSRSGATPQAMQAMECLGDDNGHRRWELGPFVFCDKCGAFTEKRMRALGRQCQGGKRNGLGALASKKRLIAGKHPITGVRIGEPRRAAAAEKFVALGQKEKTHGTGSRPGAAPRDSGSRGSQDGDGTRAERVPPPAG